MRKHPSNLLPVPPTLILGPIHLLRSLRSALVLGCLFCSPFSSVRASYEAIAGQLTRKDQERLLQLAVLQEANLAACGEAVRPQRLRDLAFSIGGEAPNLSPGERRPAAGNTSALHHRLQDFLRGLEPRGLQYFGSLRSLVAAPTPRAELPCGAAAVLTVDGREFPVHPLWPNGAAPSLTPAGGLVGPLVDAGDGDWEDLAGLDLEGSIALVNFRMGRNYQRLFDLGAQAVVVLEDEFINRHLAAGWYHQTPLPLPRFYAAGETARTLVSLVRSLAAGDAPPEARLNGGHLFRPVPVETLFYYLPPTEETAAEQPLVLLVPMESGSVVPGLPNGGRALGNLAASLAILEHLTSPGVVRRRGLFVVFLDGDTLGGAASKTLAEAALLVQNRLQSRSHEDRTAQLMRYEQVLRWMMRAEGALPRDTAAWLAREWLTGRWETVRVRLAEERIGWISRYPGKDRNSLPEQVRAALGSLEEELAWLGACRDRTFAQPGLTSLEGLEKWRSLAADPEVEERLAVHGLDYERLRKELTAEYEEEKTAAETVAGNLDLASRWLARLHGSSVPGSKGFILAWFLDLSGKTTVLGTLQNFNSDIGLDGPVVSGSKAGNFNSRWRRLCALAAVRAGWKEPFLFAGEEDKADFPILNYTRPIDYSPFWTASGLATIAVGTLNDLTELLDTPADTLDRVNFDNLAVVSRTALTLLQLLLEDTQESTPLPWLKRSEFTLLEGQALRFNIRSGIDAKDPVPDAWIYQPATPDNKFWESNNADACRGYHAGSISFTGRNGTYRTLLQVYRASRLPKIFAYRFDPALATFTGVLNEGQVGNKKQRNDYTMQVNEVVRKDLVLVETRPWVFFPGVEPREYRDTAGTSKDQVSLRLIDTLLQGEPREFAIDVPGQDFLEKEIFGLLLHVPQDRAFRFLASIGIRYRMLLTGPLEGLQGKGRVPEFPVTGSAAVLPRVPVKIAEDMQALAEARLQLYRRFGIISRPLEEAVERSRSKLQEAHQAEDKRDWQTAIGRSREAWGILLQFYPRILNLGREAVFSSIFIMALLVPAAWFLERLLIGSRSIAGRVGLAALFFGAGTFLLSRLHPAFQITVSPLIVVIAFTMMLVSALVLVLCYGRFEVLLRRARMAGGEVESEEISMATSFATAFSLGISNLRKRPVRTWLTTFTVVALTFSVVAFVSVQGQDSLRRRKVPLDPWSGNRRVDPLPPSYDGLLFRSFQWQSLSTEVVQILSTEFGSRCRLAPRAHYVEVEGGNQADREGANQIPVVFRGRQWVCSAVSLLAAEEKEVSGFPQAVSRGEWFRPAGDPLAEPGGDRFAMILPDTAAAELGITEEHIFHATGRRPWAELPEVAMMGRAWRVIGILDTGLADRLRDVNGKSFAVVDYLRSGFQKSTAGLLEGEGESYHLSWAQVPIVSYLALKDLDAQPRAVAIRLLGDSADKGRFFRDFQLRCHKAAFGCLDGQSYLLSPRREFDLAGLAKVVIPVILCILIVMNTMLGTVEERRGEVGMLGAIGLSPRQIAFLLFSEATVFSILGMVVGTFAGLSFANFLPWLHGQGQPFLSGLSFNFTSLLSMGLASTAGLAVLLATLLPAMKAAALAAPSGMTRWTLPPPAPQGDLRFILPFTMTRGNALGMALFLREFIERHADTASQDFNSRQVSLSWQTNDGCPEARLRALLFLEPYDLDVSQQCEMLLQPGKRADVFGVTIHIRRISGAEEAWVRTNYAFLDLIRRQFLLWRNLPQPHRDVWIARARQEFQQHTQGLTV